MKIIFCLPGTSFSEKFLSSWTDLLTWMNKVGIDYRVSHGVSSVVYFARANCVGGIRGRGELFNGEDYDYCMWIDSDQVFTNEDFRKLILSADQNRDKYIIGGTCKISDNIHYPIVEKREDDYFYKYGRYRFFTQKELNSKKKLFRVFFTGFAFMLIKRGVFETMEYPYFRPHWIEINDMKEFTGEDQGFCMSAKEYGFDTWVNPEVVIGHEKSVVL